jgi:multidrug efflux pump subunit AcrA (membrane-fusion protein)
LLPSTIDWDQQQQQQQQQQGQLQRQQQGPGASLARQQLPQIPEGELMSLIAAASSITDIERLLLQFHNQFK